MLVMSSLYFRTQNFKCSTLCCDANISRVKNIMNMLQSNQSTSTRDKEIGEMISWHEVFVQPVDTHSIHASLFVWLFVFGVEPRPDVLRSLFQLDPLLFSTATISAAFLRASSFCPDPPLAASASSSSSSWRLPRVDVITYGHSRHGQRSGDTLYCSTTLIHPLHPSW